MHFVLFARLLQGTAETREFASRVFMSLGLTQVEERESSNYPPEACYFIGYAANASVKVCRSDDEEFPQYPFWVELGDSRSRVQAVETLPLEVAQFVEPLVNAGIQLFQPAEAWGAVGWKPSGTVYGGA